MGAFISIQWRLPDTRNLVQTMPARVEARVAFLEEEIRTIFGRIRQTLLLVMICVLRLFTAEELSILEDHLVKCMCVRGVITSCQGKKGRIRVARPRKETEKDVWYHIVHHSNINISYSRAFPAEGADWKSWNPKQWYLGLLGFKTGDRDRLSVLYHSGDIWLRDVRAIFTGFFGD